MINERIVVNCFKTYLTLTLGLMLGLTGLFPVNATKPTDHIVDSLLKNLQTPQPDTLKARTLSRLSGVLVNENARSSLLYAFDALHLSYNPGLSRYEALYIRGMSYGALGLCYERSGKFTKAIDYLLLSQEIFKSINADSTMDYCKTMNTFGNLYTGLKKYDLAESYFLQILPLVRKLGNKKNAASLLSNLGTLYDGRKKYAKGVEYFKLSLKEEGNPIDYPSLSIASALINLASAYYDNNEFDSCQRYVNLSINVCEKLDNSYYSSVCYINAGELAFHDGELDKAERYLLKSRQLAQDAGVRTTQIDALQALVVLYKKKGNLQLALKYQELLTQLKDAVLNKKVYQTVNDAQITNEINKRDRKISLLNKDKEIADSKSRLEAVLRNSLLIGIALALIVCVSLFSNVRNKRKANLVLVAKNRQIEKQQEVIEAKNQELDSYNKELIVENVVAKYEILKSKINPHFLFNSLATLTTIVKQDQDLATVYIGRFSELYRRLLNSENQSLITLDEEMELVDYYLFLEKMRFEDKLDVHIDLAPDLMKFFLPPFCLQMMVENAIKHNSITNAKRLFVKIYTEDTMVCVSNNLQRKHAAPASTSTGQKNVTGRYVLMTKEIPVFIETETEYIVKLPLIPKEQKTDN